MGRVSTKKIVTILPESLWESVQMYAFEEELTNQEVIRNALREFFEDWEPEKETIEAFSEEGDEEGDDDDEAEEEEK